MARTCALLASCSVAADVGPTFAADCVRIGREMLAGLPPRYEAFGPMQKRQLACIVDARDCAELTACLSGGRPRDFCQRRGSLTCDGDVIIDCEARYSPPLLRGYPVMIDCPAQDQTCFQAGGGAICTTGVSCTGTAERCDGPYLRGCEDGVETLSDCRPIFGPESMCIVEKNEFNCTVADHPPCETPDRCEGSTAVICREGRLFRLDCPRAWEGDCAGPGDGGVAGGVARCVPAAHACDDADPPRCDGDALALCVNGRVRTVACASIGLRACSAAPRARCVE